MTWARYDGMADWYDETVATWSATATPLLLGLAGPGPGSCLDVGCGTGVHLAALAGAGWSVVGLDASADQLRLAVLRPGPPGVALVQADATALPFPDGSLDLVVSAFTHTDVDDFDALAAEAHCVLRPTGRFVYVGLHPCFTGPFAEQPRPDGARVVHHGYRIPGRQSSGPGTVPGGLTTRVGFRTSPSPPSSQASSPAASPWNRSRRRGTAACRTGSPWSPDATADSPLDNRSTGRTSMGRSFRGGRRGRPGRGRSGPGRSSVRSSGA
jgi:SAM-dependent methyltransferase